MCITEQILLYYNIFQVKCVSKPRISINTFGNTLGDSEMDSRNVCDKRNLCHCCVLVTVKTMVLMCC